uniref:RNA-directed DNA polymerase n=1 Tax=Trichogramma kaykai TaxID=54128 RepID=A0ABD2WAS9_9HYME
MKRAAHLLAPLNVLIVGAKKKDSTPILWSEAADRAFKESKQALANATLLAYPQENAKLRLVTDASAIAAGAALEQETTSGWKPLGLFSKKFTSGQRKYAPYDLELTAIFLAIKHFHTQLEGRDFDVLCDHKPLQYAFTQSPEQVPLVRQRQLAFISQYTTSIKYLPGKENPVADALSRIDTGSPLPQDAACVDAFALPTDIPISRLAEVQNDDEELPQILSRPDYDLKLTQLEWFDQSNKIVHIYCEVVDELIRPYIPKSLRHEAFSICHSLSHAGPRATFKLMQRKFVWPSMSKDVKEFCKLCLPYESEDCDRQTFTSEFRSHMQQVRPVLTTLHQETQPFVHKSLQSCTHVFLRAPPIKKPLDPPYVGPFKIHRRASPHFYIIRMTNKRGLEELKAVSTLRIKPAHGTFEDIDLIVNDDICNDNFSDENIECDYTLDVPEISDDLAESKNSVNKDNQSVPETVPKISSKKSKDIKKSSDKKSSDKKACIKKSNDNKSNQKKNEIVGIVESIDNCTGNNIFKFLLRNDSGDKIQIFAWGKYADRIRGYVKVNFVTHIDGGYAKTKHSVWSKGTTKMDIHLVGNAVVNVLKKLNPPPTVKANVSIVRLEDVMSHTKEIIAVTGHLNSEIMAVTLKQGGRVGQTTIVQGDHKLEIKVNSFENSTFKENNHVKIVGRIISYGIPYMQVDNLDCITIIDNVELPLLDLLKGTRIPKRKSTDNAE